MKDPEKENKKENIKPKKNRRLLVQVGLIFAIIFALVIIAVSVLVVKGHAQTYFQAKEQMLSPILRRSVNELTQLENFQWFLDFWEEHWEEIKAMDEDECMDLLFEHNINADKLESSYSLEELNALNPRVQIAYARQMYYSFSITLNLSQWQLNNEHLSCFDISDSNPGFVFVDCRMSADLLHSDDSYSEETLMTLGLTVEDISGFKSVRTMNKSTYAAGASNIYFERYDDAADGEYYYYGFEPIIYNGKVRAVMCIQHNWSEFHSQMLLRFTIITIMSAAIIFVAGAILLLYINKAAIHPVSLIQKGIQQYIENKDSTQVAEQMEKVRTNNEFGVLADHLSALAVEIDRYTAENAHLIGERQRVETELSLAADIQRSMLPATFPEEKGFLLYASMTPAKEVGGDLYNFFPLDDTHTGLVIGDVSGKGVPAALVMMITQLLIRQRAQAGLSPAEVFAKANELLCENNQMEMFATAWFGILDHTTGKIIACSAGHEYPILKTGADGFRIMKDPHSFVLAGMETSKYTNYEVDLAPGDVLFLYSDGAPEATNAENELFGTDRMLEVLNRNKEAGPKELIEAMKADISRFVGDAPQFDDLTMLCVKLKQP